MPHYKDGTEAQPGDLVAGKSYNHKGRYIVGELLQITPGSDSCNCMVSFVDVVAPEKAFGVSFLTRRAKDGIANGGVSESVAVTPMIDYGQVSDFELVYRKPPAEQTAVAGI